MGTVWRQLWSHGLAEPGVSTTAAVLANPVLPFLVFLEFLDFLPCEEFLVFLSVFPFFSRDFRGSVGIKNPCFFGGFPCLFPKKQGKEGQGSLPERLGYLGFAHM